jgi:general secretion pathway protein A
MDLLKYYGLQEQPFRIGPDPRYLYFSDQVKEALAKCQYMAKERIGPIYIYGPIGSGKTSILRRLNDVLSQDAQNIVAYLISPTTRRSNAFLRLILESFDVKTERSEAQSLKNLEVFLSEAYKNGQYPVLLVDEAQNLNRDVLRLIHYLLNFETATTKLLQVILVGQEELASKILRYRELASRMFPIAMSAMSVVELQSMVEFRWMVAGGKDNPFESRGDEVYKTIFSYSKGLPRDTVKLCDELLRDLMAENQKKATPKRVETVAKSLNLTL